LLNIIIHFRKPWQQVGWFATQGNRKAKQRFDPDLASVLLDQINLRSMKPSRFREPFL